MVDVHTWRVDMEATVWIADPDGYDTIAAASLPVGTDDPEIIAAAAGRVTRRADVDRRQRMLDRKELRLGLTATVVRDVAGFISSSGVQPDSETLAGINHLIRDIGPDQVRDLIGEVVEAARASASHPGPYRPEWYQALPATLVSAATDPHRRDTMMPRIVEEGTAARVDLTGLGALTAEVTRLRTATETARTARDDAIRQAHAAGVTVPQLVETTGLTRVRIYQIVGPAEGESDGH